MLTVELPFSGREDEVRERLCLGATTGLRLFRCCHGDGGGR